MVVMSKTFENYTRVTTKTLAEMKVKGEKIAMLTAYDFTMAGILDHAGIDIILAVSYTHLTLPTILLV